MLSELTTLLMNSWSPLKYYIPYPTGWPFIWLSIDIPVGSSRHWWHGLPWPDKRRTILDVSLTKKFSSCITIHSPQITVNKIGSKSGKLFFLSLFTSYHLLWVFKPTKILRAFYTLWQITFCWFLGICQIKV